MSKPKLVTLIEGLEVSEIASLKKYVLTKTSMESDTYYIFDYILKHRNDASMIESGEVLVKNALPNLRLKNISNYLSTLFSWAEEWIIQCQMEKEKHTGDLLVLKWLNKKGFYHLADITARRIEKNIESNPTLDIEDHKAKAALLACQLISNNPYKHEAKEEKFTEMVKSHNEVTKAQNLIFKAELNNWGSIINHDYSNLIKYIDNINAQIEDSTLTALLEAMNQLITHTDLVAFNHLKQTLFDHKLDTKSELHYIIATYCINRSRRFWTQGIITEPKFLYEMYEYGLNSGVLLSNGKVQSATFHNIVVQLTQANTFEEVEAFIEKWLPKVSTENVEATRALAMAQNCFYFARYHEIFQYTWRSDFPTFNQKNTAQGLYLIAAFMYRKDDAILFQNTMNSFQYFIKRNKAKMSQHLYECYTNLIDFMNRYDKGLITEKQLSYSPIMYKMWCQKMLDELKN